MPQEITPQMDIQPKDGGTDICAPVLLHHPCGGIAGIHIEAVIVQGFAASCRSLQAESMWSPLSSSTMDFL